MSLNVRFIFRKHTKLFVHIQQVVVGVELKLRKFNFASFFERNLEEFVFAFIFCFTEVIAITFPELIRVEPNFIKTRKLLLFKMDNVECHLQVFLLFLTATYRFWSSLNVINISSIRSDFFTVQGVAG